VSADADRVVRLGEICGVHGVKGWVRLRSFTDPRTNLFDYADWLIDSADGRRAVAVEASGTSGKHLIAKLAGVDDRDAAAALIGAGIGVPRSALPSCEPGEYYWTDLEGLTVRTEAGDSLGTVERLVATGANDVLVLDGERMIPFVAERIVKSVDVEAREIVVDWDASYWE
jgi:16S rRNA processing protein RimM